MKKQLLLWLVVLTIVVSLFAGCGDQPAVDPTPSDKPQPKAQAVVALNPVLVYDDGTTAIAYNDIRGAAKSDREAAALTALHGQSGWTWAYKQQGYWQQRGIYGLGNWKNGVGAAAKKTAAYAFDADASISLATYAPQAPAVTGYAGATLPEVGVLMSVTGKEEEALCYTATKDGVLQIPAGTVAAVETVGGVKTGFLAEDGTARRASVRILRNDVQLWSGTLMNATASPDGVAVTALAYPQLNDIAVSAGDKVFVAVTLDAAANRDEDVTDKDPNEADNWTVIKTESQIEMEKPLDAVQSDGSIAFITDYVSTFAWVRNSQASPEMQAIEENYYALFAKKMDAVVKYYSEHSLLSEYELVVGVVPSRPVSVQLHEELISYRTNHAADYIIRLVGQSLYIVADNDKSLEAALAYFMEHICVNDASTVPVNYNRHYAPRLQSVTLLGADIGSYVIRTERFPSYVVQMAAEDLQDYVRQTCGYVLEIRPESKAGGNSADREIRVGPIQNEVKADRVYDTRFDVTNTDRYLSIEDDGLLDVPETDFRLWVEGNDLCLNGGSTYAINAGMQQLLKDIAAGQVPAGYGANGSYDKGYSLSRGYAVTLADEFNYAGDTVEQDVRKLWDFSVDTTPGPTPLVTDPKTGEVTVWDEQRRPDEFGENWWIWQSHGNGYLMEVTKKEPYGYDAIRMISENQMSFRFGIWETRLVPSTRNGACSCLWTENQKPLKTALRPEIDVYENYGRDGFRANLHTWDDYELDPEDGHVDHHTNGDHEFQWMEPSSIGEEHFYDTFHHMGFVWTPDGIDLFMDGLIYDSIRFNSRNWDAFRTTSAIIRLTNGVGAMEYAKNNDPYDYMDDVSKFFEVNIVDYTRIYQTDFSKEPKERQSQLVFSRKSGWNDTEYRRFTNK